MPAEIAAFEDVHCIRSTVAAALVVIEGEEFWIPASQIEEESEVRRDGDEGTLVIRMWCARQKGLV